MVRGFVGACYDLREDLLELPQHGSAENDRTDRARVGTCCALRSADMTPWSYLPAVSALVRLHIDAADAPKEREPCACDEGERCGQFAPTQDGCGSLQLGLVACFGQAVCALLREGVRGRAFVG